MKLFAFKQQKYNPNKPANINGELLWLKEVIEEVDRLIYENDNWVVLDSDDFVSYLYSQGQDPSKVFI